MILTLNLTYRDTHISHNGYMFIASFSSVDRKFYIDTNHNTVTDAVTRLGRRDAAPVNSVSSSM